MASFGSATLIVHGPEGGIPVALPMRRIVIGRSAVGNDIVITHPSIAKRHCEFDLEDGELIVRDLGSPQGTWINGHRIHAARVYDGDHLRIGEAEGIIEVRRRNGKPLIPPGERTPLPLAALLIALLLLLGGVLVLLLFQQRLRDRSLLAEYEARAQAFLRVPSPCAIARAAVTGLSETEDRLTKLGLSGRRPRSMDSDHLRTLLAISEPREEQLRIVLSDLDRMVDVPLHQAWRELQPYELRVHQPAVATSIQALHRLFADQIAAQEAYQDGLRRYLESVQQTNALLRKLSDSNVQTASDAFGVSSERVADLQSKCESAFTQLNAQGMLKLASISM
jgi:pSer/pThr/pTyr-binding forkhead associated (FHA) protein